MFFINTNILKKIVLPKNESNYFVRRFISIHQANANLLQSFNACSIFIQQARASHKAIARDACI
jgi:hypothetical protein